MKIPSWLMIGSALLAALIFSMLVILIFDGDFQTFLLTYYMPVGIPFVMFCFDRLERWLGIISWQRRLDVGVILVAMARAALLIPFISGHALFLTYAFFTTQSRITRLASALVMLEVFYFKVLIWQDKTIFTGVIVGCIAAWGFHKLAYNRSKASREIKWQP